MTDTTPGYFGSQTEEIEHLLVLVHDMSIEQAQEFASVGQSTGSDDQDEPWLTAWVAASDADDRAACQDRSRRTISTAMWDAMRDAALDTAWYKDQGPARDAAWDAVRDAALALMVWDLVGQYGLTQDHVETLIEQAERVFGPLRPVSGGAS
jgi:hypothetical protein